MRGAKNKVCLVSIVSTASELNVVDCWWTARGMGRDMMVFKKTPFATAPATLAYERAAPPFSEPYRPFDLGWDVSRALDVVSALTRVVRGSQLLFGRCSPEAPPALGQRSLPGLRLESDDARDPAQVEASYTFQHLP